MRGTKRQTGRDFFRNSKSSLSTSIGGGSRLFRRYAICACLVNEKFIERCKLYWGGLPGADAQRESRCKSHSLRGVDLIHVREPGMSIFQISDAPGEGTIDH